MLEMEEEFRYGLMDQDMMDFGRTEWLMVEVDLFMLMETFMKVNGSKIKLMDMEYNKIITEVGTKANGKTTNNTATVSKSGPTAALTKESTKKE
jgi:hypothetical protein